MHTSDTTPAVLPTNADIDNIGRYPAGVVVVAAIVGATAAVIVGLLVAGILHLGGAL